MFPRMLSIEYNQARVTRYLKEPLVKTSACIVVSILCLAHLLVVLADETPRPNADRLPQQYVEVVLGVEGMI